MSYYDDVISPKLLEIGLDLQSRGIPFCFTVGDGDEVATTADHNGSLPLRLVTTISRCTPNIDAFLLNLKRQGVDLSGCMCVTPVLREKQ